MGFVIDSVTLLPVPFLATHLHPPTPANYLGLLWNQRAGERD